eukprot:CAMPEP_0119334230 /NCGR_PEP_ID=MMETSP1333-20130426/86861_1 /TAXON_ID=418940 /ORGANISM="Scyphosphaera apsteinii, Strain RCC1455" /LENGTH=197 /DNA_ID=CAMNT_0007344483 /DNA_START=21 /DNA_END=614 /DNA_ORIENTATION=-
MTMLSHWEISQEGEVDFAGCVALNELVSVQVHQSDDQRLDIKFKSGFIQLCAPSNVERDDWAFHLQQALVHTMRQSGGVSTGTSLGLLQFPEADDMIEVAVIEVETECVEQVGTSGEAEKNVSVMRSSNYEQRTAFLGTKERTPSLTEAKDPQHKTDTNITCVAPVVYMSRLDRARKANAARERLSRERSANKMGGE